MAAVAVGGGSRGGKGLRADDAFDHRDLPELLPGVGVGVGEGGDVQLSTFSGKPFGIFVVGSWKNGVSSSMSVIATRNSVTGRIISGNQVCGEHSVAEMLALRGAASFLPEHLSPDQHVRTIFTPASMSSGLTLWRRRWLRRAMKYAAEALLSASESL